VVTSELLRAIHRRLRRLPIMLSEKVPINAVTPVLVTVKVYFSTLHPV
jgi:hypothetical protein